MICIAYNTIILLSEYNMLHGMLNMIWLQYNTAKNVLCLYLDSPTPGTFVKFVGHMALLPGWIIVLRKKAQIHLHYSLRSTNPAIQTATNTNPFLCIQFKSYGCEIMRTSWFWRINDSVLTKIMWEGLDKKLDLTKFETITIKGICFWDIAGNSYVT